jgi:hypothetical protein
MTSRARPTAEESATKASPKTVKKGFAERGSLNYRFSMPLGDWSGDGHGRTQAFVFGCNSPMAAVVAAFEGAVNKLPGVAHPTSIFSEYGNRSLDAEAYFAMFDAGYDMLAEFNEAKERARRVKELPRETWEVILDYPQVECEDLALYVLWFCQQGNPSLVFSEEDSDSLFGYGGIRDAVGYGLF